MFALKTISAGNCHSRIKLNNEIIEPVVVACTCNPATLDAKFRNGVGLIPAVGSSPSIGGWIV